MTLRTLSLVPVLALLAAAMFMPLPQEWSSGWRGDLLDRLHTPLFALLGLALKHRRPWVTFLLATSVAALIEYIQPSFGRSASLPDLGWGMIGATGAMLWQNRHAWVKVSALLLAVAPPGMLTGQVALARLTAVRQFPVLFAAAEHQNTILWQVSRRAQKTPEGFTLGRGSSIRLEITDKNWSRFEALELVGELKAPTPTGLGLRLDMESPSPNRIHLEAVFKPGPNRVRVPWPVRSKLSPVRQIVLFVSAGRTPASLRVQEIRLVSDVKK